MRASRLALPTVLIAILGCEVTLRAQTTVTLTPTTTPTAGQAGITNIIITGSGFPAATIQASNTDVKLEPAAGGPAVSAKASAIATVVGTTRRVTFLIPSSVNVISPAAYLVSVSGTASDGTAFASSNKASLTVNPAASISSLNPNTGQAGQTVAVTITGQFSNFVQGATQANFGVGISVGNAAEGALGPVTVSNATTATAQLRINASAVAGPRNVVVQTGVQQAVLSGGFSVTPGGSAIPTITDFNPKTASIGTLVTITGTNLQPAAGTAALVTLVKLGGGTIAGPVSSAAATALAFVVPAGAVTGPLTVTVNGGSVSAVSPLTIAASAAFSLSAAPGAADVIQGQAAAYAVKLTSNNGFSQLAALSVTGLPAGVTASFNPQKVTAGQTSILRVAAPIGQPTGPSTLTVSASATVDDLPLAQSATLTLNVKPIATSLVGRTVDSDTLETPLAGVTITMRGKDGNGNNTGCTGNTASDGAGNFALINLPPACIGPQLVGFDGTTVTNPPGKFSGVNLVFTFSSGQVTASPVLVHLPRTDNKETLLIQQTAPTDQTYSFASIPGLSITVYAGTTLTLANGSQPNPFPLTAVEVPVDRLPGAKPPVPTMLGAFFVSFSPANTRASKPVAVYYPNTLNTPPGTNLTLMTLDPTRGSMVPYGTGTVGNNGVQIVPDPDPAVPGHRYGLVNFDWHAPMPPPPPVRVMPDPGGPTTCNPIDISSGAEIIREIDIQLQGSRGSIFMERVYRTLSSGQPGPFGIGTNHNYGYQLNTLFPATDATFNLVMPDGNQFPFVRQPDGTLINTTIPSLRGAVMTNFRDGTIQLRWKDGTVYQFAPIGPLVFNLPILVSITDPNLNMMTLSRNISSPSQITGITDPVGRQLLLAYDSSNRIISIVDPIGRTVRYTYNAQGTLETITDPEGGVTRYGYDSQNRLTQITDSRGIITVQNVYDVNGRVVDQTQADGGHMSFSYTLTNPLMPTSPVLRTMVTDPLGNVSSYRFNTEGFVVDVTDALGQTRVFERAPGTNLMLSIRGAANCGVCGVPSAGDVVYTYDGFGNRLTETDALGNATRYTYEPVFNKVSTVTDVLGNVTRFSYDGAGNLISITDANNKITTLSYDSSGLVTVVTDPLGQKTTLSYDSLGNRSSLSDALGSTTLFLYDGVSRMVGAIDAMGRQSSTAYDRLDRKVTQTDPSNGVTQFAYDTVGNLLSLTDAKGNRTAFTYDSMSRTKTRTTPAGRNDTRNYDFNGNLIGFTDRRGQTSSFGYDALNRLIAEVYQDSNVARVYDSNGRLARVDDSPGGVFTFSYDLTGRLLSNSGSTGTVRYTRDGLGRVVQRQVVGQSAVAYSYDPVGNLLSSAMPQASVSTTYDARNEPTLMTRSNGVNSAYGYDAVGRVLSIVHSKGSTALNSQSYGYDAAGNRNRQSTDIAQPLITQAAVSQVDVENHLLQRGSTTYTYDANGNRLTETGPSGITSYSWDSRNRLASLTEPGGKLTTFQYDSGLNLMSRTTNGLMTAYVLDDLTNVALQSDTSGLQFSILSGRSIDQHYAVSQSNGTMVFGLPDEINSNVAAASESGVVTGQSFYEPFGQTAASTLSYPFLYTGRVSMPAGLLYYRARLYDPNAGRFISEDPSGLGVGTNSYEYAGNNPVGLTDPSGLEPTGGTKTAEQWISEIETEVCMKHYPGFDAKAAFFQEATRKRDAGDSQQLAYAEHYFFAMNSGLGNLEIVRSGGYEALKLLAFTADAGTFPSGRYYAKTFGWVFNFGRKKWGAVPSAPSFEAVRWAIRGARGGEAGATCGCH